MGAAACAATIAAKATTFTYDELTDDDRQWLRRGHATVRDPAPHRGGGGGRRAAAGRGAAAAGARPVEAVAHARGADSGAQRRPAGERRQGVRHPVRVRRPQLHPDRALHPVRTRRPAVGPRVRRLPGARRRAGDGRAGRAVAVGAARVPARPEAARSRSWPPRTRSWSRTRSTRRTCRRGRTGSSCATWSGPTAPRTGAGCRMRRTTPSATPGCGSTRPERWRGRSAVRSSRWCWIWPARCARRCARSAGRTSCSTTLQARRPARRPRVPGQGVRARAGQGVGQTEGGGGDRVRRAGHADDFGRLVA